MESELKSYSATFSGGDPDSVTRWRNGENQTESMQLWWRLLSTRRDPSSASARSITDVASGYPNAALLPVASETYLRAIGEDLQQASCQVTDPDLLCIISAGSKESGSLKRYITPSDARLRTVVGGGIGSLNVRIARKFLTESKKVPIRAMVLRERYSDLLAEQPLPQRYMRQQVANDQIINFIRVALRSDPIVSRSSLLRRLRDSGVASEQSRFSSLYSTVLRRESQRAL
jgi:hypothetical protein